MTEAQNVFEPYLGAPVTSQCYKELGQKIQQYSQSEREALFASFQPKELHLQLLKLTVARTSGCHLPLLNGLKEECKLLSGFSLKCRVLFNGSNKQLLDVNFLLPLLQTVSSSTRNRILWNLGKYCSTGGSTKVSEADFDSLYHAVLKIWGSNIALPLLSQTSKEVLERELPNVANLSKAHLLVIAKKFPFLALSFLQQPSTRGTSLTAKRYIVRKTIPTSLDYIVKQGPLFLTKSLMRIILKDHSDVVLESPSAWLNVLDKHVVKKVLRPEHFELFISKQFLQLKDMNIPRTLLSCFEILSPSEVSGILNKFFTKQYGLPLTSRLDFWEKNINLLKLLDASDRSAIAVGLSTKDPLSTQWLPLMTTDISIPRIKKLLSTEQDARGRASHLSRLIETAVLNKDESAIEDICKLVVDRYRNDKVTLASFFNSDLKFLSLSTETFDLVFAAAKRFYDPNDWQTRSAAKLFPIAIKRNWGEAGLKEFLVNLMKNVCCFSTFDLCNLEKELRPICIEEVFTTDNIGNKQVLRILAQFLTLVTKWSATSSLPLINDNVQKCVLTLLERDIDRRVAIAFVCSNLTSLSLQFIEDCFQHVPDPKIMAYLLLKNSYILTTEETWNKIGKHILEFGVHGFITLLKKMKRLGPGYRKALQFLAIQSKQVLDDKTETENLSKYTNAVILLMLTSQAEDYFSIIDPLLPSTENNTVTPPSSQASGDSSNKGRYCSLRASKREDAIYYGFGMSISHLELPGFAVERLQRFCVSGDLIIFVRDALYSICGSLPNDKAKSLLLSLMKQPVSVKKHALRLLWRTVCNIETQEVLLLKLMESEEHLTMRIILLDTAFTSLNVTKYISMWQVVRDIINKLTPDDKTIFFEILKKTVPNPFLEEFYQILLEKCKILKDIDIDRIINSVIQQISNVVSLMSEKFIENLIVEYFLSEMFFGQVYSHSGISSVFLRYLQGLPGSSMFVNESGKVPESHKSLDKRQQFLKERLESCSIEGPRDVFDSVQGMYPVRRLLKMFIESFCESCLVLQPEMQIPHKYQLISYTDLLLSYFEQFNHNSTIWLRIFLSSTKLMKTNASESAFVVGQKFGELCDTTCLKSSAALFCYYPTAVANFFNIFVSRCSLYTNSQILDIYRGMLETVRPSCGSENSPEDLCNTLRLVTVAHMLPTHWVVGEEYKEFRQMFFVLIQNTPAEVYLFNSR